MEAPANVHEHQEGYSQPTSISSSGRSGGEYFDATQSSDAGPKLNPPRSPLTQSTKPAAYPDQPFVIELLWDTLAWCSFRVEQARIGG